MEKNKNTSKIIIAAFSAFFLAGMIFATLFDFEISAFLTQLKQEENSFSMTFPLPSLFLEILGEWPASVFGAFCAAVIMRSLLGTKKPAGYAGAAGMILLIFYVMYDCCEHTVEDVNFLVTDVRTFGTGDLIVAIPLTIIASLAVILVALMISQKAADRLLVPAIICAVMLASLLVGVQFIKALWGRIRFRDLFEAMDFSGFTAWYVPSFFSGGKSFPSGHTANAAALGLIPLFYSAKLKKRFPWLAKATYIAVAVWAVVMAFTRITVGAHYLSDVLVGGALAFTAVMLGHYFMNKIRNA
ncbi:MAG: phosphatase PAP2 family protein [Clostridia bacterium]|nr:phosphatase PAP2 family protein [Clostridia bacterium]